jgi:carbonic anhydrase
LLNLKAQPSVSRAMREGRLKVFGWYYDILSGRIEQFDEEERRFIALV